MLLLWYARSSSLPPPPTWSTKGVSDSARVSQNWSRSGCVGARSPAGSDGTITAAQPASIASVAATVAFFGSFNGMLATASSRGSWLQKSAIARLKAEVPT